MRIRTLLLMIGTAAGCATPPANSARDSASDTANARDHVARLEADARALANATGCASSGGCRTAPVGSRACGGPRTYLVYCAATTDSVALFRKLGELKVAEEKANAASGMASTCEFRMPPALSADGGSCRPAPAP